AWLHTGAIFVQITYHTSAKFTSPSPFDISASIVLSLNGGPGWLEVTLPDTNTRTGQVLKLSRSLRFKHQPTYNSFEFRLSDEESGLIERGTGSSFPPIHEIDG